MRSPHLSSYLSDSPHPDLVPGLPRVVVDPDQGLGVTGAHHLGHHSPGLYDLTDPDVLALSTEVLTVTESLGN